MVAFLAFIMLGIDAILGVFSRRSQVIMPGGLNFMVWRPVSTSLVTFTSPFTISILEAKVAWGQSSSPARIWPVWLQSSSTATLPHFYTACQATPNRSYPSTRCASKPGQRSVAAGQNHAWGKCWYISPYQHQGQEATTISSSLYLSQNPTPLDRCSMRWSPSQVSSPWDWQPPAWRSRRRG